MNASDKSAISALRSCMVLTTCSLVSPRWPTSRRISESGITPMASPPPASTASASAPISPTQPPPYTRPIPRSASSLPSRCAASLYAGRIPNDEPQNTHTLLIFIRSSQKKNAGPTPPSSFRTEGRDPLAPSTSFTCPFQPAASCLHARLVHQLRGHFHILHLKLLRLGAQIFKQEGAQVALAKIRHHHNNQLAIIVRSRSQLQRLRHRRAAGNPNQQAFFFGHPARRLHGFFRGGGHDFIYQVCPQDLGNESRAQPLNFLWPRLASGNHRRIPRLHGHNLKAGLFGLDVLAHAGQRAARAHAGNQDVDFAVRVIPDFRSRRVTMYLRIRR